MTRIVNINTPLLPKEERLPTKRMIQVARLTNRGITVIGMTSLGLLAALITHHTLENKNWPIEAIVTADAISFFTAISGKVAIVLFFNEAPFLEGFKKICRQQLPDYFKLAQKNKIEKLQWGINLILSVNASLFWGGLVEVSFKKSGDLLKQFDTKTTRVIGDHLQQWYVYLPFVLSSFSANIIAWPGALTGAYQQKKALLNWFRKRPWQSNPREAELNEVNSRVESIHRRVLHELKKIIEGSKQSPAIDKLLGTANENENGHNNVDDFHCITINKLDNLLTLRSDELRTLYLENSDTNYTPLSKKQKFLKYSVALGVSGAAIYGYRNVVGLSHTVWKNWHAENVSKYGAAYVAYYSNAEVVLLTAFPLICNLFDVARQGITPYVFSWKKLVFTISMVFFVGVFGGLANAEQSYLDGESIFDVVNADIASFLLDAFSIYMVFKSTFEQKIRESPATNSTIILKQRFLQLQALGQQACALNSLDDEEQETLSAPMDAIVSEEDDTMTDDEEDTIHRRRSCTIL